jgi:dihydrodipicolinate synthase/N-acetylneuraminate lyase
MSSNPFVSRLRSSVIAVPPLARDASLAVDWAENAKLIGYLKSGGVRTLLYGGNAIFYHIRPSEFEDAVRMLVDEAGEDTWVIPSLGPSFGLMMDQAEVLSRLPVDTAMVLPQREVADAIGIAEGIRRVVDRLGKPIVLYLKFDRWLPPAVVENLVHEGRVSWIKYAVVREDARADPYLRELLQVVPRDIVVSGMGEQPAIIHMKEFGMVGYTSGCVCVHPQLATDFLGAIARQDWDEADRIRKRFEPLEDLRNEISPIRVLHRAVEYSGKSKSGPILPLLGELSSVDAEKISRVVRELIAKP